MTQEIRSIDLTCNILVARSRNPVNLSDHGIVHESIVKSCRDLLCQPRRATERKPENGNVTRADTFQKDLHEQLCRHQRK